ncbi:hypothetical protein, partial [Macromonas nakdongensis]|uniref:hypothetical protein n=1 Tax=Macromonas nakdongensis TaxID=1843082 RepID=UPI0012FEC08C
EGRCRRGDGALEWSALFAQADAALAAQAEWLREPCSPAPGAAAPVARPRADPAGAAWRELEALEAALRQGDMGVFDAWADWTQHHGRALGADTEAASLAIDNFDIDAALVEIECIKKQLFDPDLP